MKLKLNITRKSFSLFFFILLSFPSVLFFQNCGQGAFDISSLGLPDVAGLSRNQNETPAPPEMQDTPTQDAPREYSGDLIKLKSFGGFTYYTMVSGITTNGEIVHWGGNGPLERAPSVDFFHRNDHLFCSS